MADHFLVGRRATGGDRTAHPQGLQRKPSMDNRRAIPVIVSGFVLLLVVQAMAEVRKVETVSIGSDLVAARESRTTKTNGARP